MVRRIYKCDLDCPWEEIRPIFHPECVEEMEQEIIKDKRQFVTVPEAVALLSLHTDTLKAAIIKGRLKAFRLESGEWQIPIEEIENARKNDLRSP